MKNQLLLANVFIAFLTLLWVITMFFRASDILLERELSLPMYVTPSDQGTLIVRGFRDGGNEFNGYRIGDEIIAIAGVDQIPQSQIAFRTAYINAGGEVTVQRGEEIIQDSLEVERRPAAFLSLIKHLLRVY